MGRRYAGQQPRTKSDRLPADKPRVNRTFCSPIGLHRVYFVRASRDTSRRVFFDRLESVRDGCLLGEQIRRRPILLRPAPPRCPAVRRPVPTRPWYVRVLDSTNHLSNPNTGDPTVVTSIRTTTVLEDAADAQTY